MHDVLWYIYYFSGYFLNQQSQHCSLIWWLSSFTKWDDIHLLKTHYRTDCLYEMCLICSLRPQIISLLILSDLLEVFPCWGVQTMHWCPSVCLSQVLACHRHGPACCSLHQRDPGPDPGELLETFTCCHVQLPAVPAGAQQTSTELQHWCGMLTINKTYCSEQNGDGS